MTIELFRDLATGLPVARFSVGGDWGDREVSVVGPFNDWTPGIHVLTPRRDGTRSGTVDVDEGADVHFRYLASGDDWFDDPDADEVGEYGSVMRWPTGVTPTDARAATAVRSTPTKATAKKVTAQKAAAPKEVAEPTRPRPKPTKKAAAKKVADLAAAKKVADLAAAKRTAAKKTVKKAAGKKSDG